ncbi:MAG: zinc ribbon domain-containing protein [Clostridia bacterium]|nr:zinc ribbon domain-containing protein [Clostridia bacterium]
MYCNKCGNPINAGANFCPACGKNIGVSYNSNQKKLLEYSKYLIGATPPVLLILRMLMQEERSGFGWSKYTYHTVPSNYKVIMIVIALGMLGTALYLKSRSGLKSKTVFVCGIIATWLSFLIIFVNI